MTTPNTTEEEKRMKRKAPTKFEQGYIAACAEIVRSHDQPTIAKDVLRAIVPESINWDNVEPYEVQTLSKAGLIE